MKPAAGADGNGELMSNESLDQIGALVDKADNFAAAAILPLPAKMHAEQLVRGMEDIRDQLRAIYIKETGKNPWEDSL